MRTALRWFGRALLALVLIVVAFATVPARTGSLDSRAEATGTYDEAMARFETLTTGEDDVFEPCRSAVMSHGERTEVAVVLFHGLTNCPEQFLEFGRELHDAGANVVILRAPHHGLADATGAAIGSVSNAGELTAEDLRDFADDSVDVATGLGDDVRVLGLSMGGVLALWTAQFRADVDRVVAVAPAVSVPGTPGVVTLAVRNLFHRLPDISLPGESNLDHAYVGESTRALSSMFLLARAVERSASDRPGSAGEAIVVINPDDDQVDANDVRFFAIPWIVGDERVQITELPAAGLPHDVIDPDQPAGDVALVYPILLGLLEG